MPSEGPLAGRCGARLRKKPGQYCTQWPVAGGRRCRLHGGTGLIGPLSSSWKDGKYAERYREVLHGTALGARVEAVQSSLDEDLADQGPQLALLYGRIAELVSQLEQRQARSWGEARAALAVLRAAESPDELGRALGDLQTVIDDATSTEATWNSIERIMGRAAQLAAVEVRRRQFDADMVNAERLDAFLTLCIGAIRDLVHDSRTRRALAVRLMELRPRQSA